MDRVSVNYYAPDDDVKISKKKMKMQTNKYQALMERKIFVLYLLKRTIYTMRVNKIKKNNKN